MIEFPFPEDEAERQRDSNHTERGLFCVFDGHAGKNCAIAAKREFPKVILMISITIQNNRTTSIKIPNNERS